MGVSSRWFARSGAVVVAAAAVVTGCVALGPSAPQATAAPAATDGVDLLGHGFGHGRGMGQYGSYGYAVDKGWSSAAILDHYFGGTTAGSVGDREMTVRITRFDGAAEVAVTSRVDFWVGNGPGATLVPGGSAAVVTRAGGGWQLTVRDGGCTGPVTRPTAPLPSTPEAAPSVPPGTDPMRMITTCSGGTNFRGLLRWATDGGSPRLVNVLSTEDYLRGVVPRESPAGWADAAGGRGAQALQAQSVAARSYALSENRHPYAKTCDTQSCQVYGGAATQGRWLEDGRTDAAIAATAGVVRLRGSSIVRTEFSSSTGGWTAGGQFPAVQDEGDSRSPNATWRVRLTGSAIAAKYPQIGQFSSLQVVGRNGLGAEGGRVTAMDVVGTGGTVRVNGNGFRVAMGLKSDWFTPAPAPVVAPPPPAPPAPAPVVTPAPAPVVTPQGPNALLWQARQSAGPGTPALTTVYGGAATTALSCDFDGDGRDDVAAFQNGHWEIRHAFLGGGSTREFDYGFPGSTPVCGDWNGDGVDGIGVFHQGDWYLRQSATPGTTYAGRFAYGTPDALPVVGDWDGNGTGPGPASAAFSYGFAGATPVTADWNGDGRTDIGVFVDGDWYLRDSATPGPARMFNYGFRGSVPVTGDWDGTPGDGIAVVSKTYY